MDTGAGGRVEFLEEILVYTYTRKPSTSPAGHPRGTAEPAVHAAREPRRVQLLRALRVRRAGPGDAAPPHGGGELPLRVRW